MTARPALHRLFNPILVGLFLSKTRGTEGSAIHANCQVFFQGLLNFGNFSSLRISFYAMEGLKVKTTFKNVEMWKNAHEKTNILCNACFIPYAL